jgi:hypothetical protein
MKGRRQIEGVKMDLELEVMTLIFIDIAFGFSRDRFLT